MSNLKEIEKMKLESMFSMSSGYVLDFSNQSLQSFIYNTIKIDLYNPKYEKYGTSKAKRLKALWEIEGDISVGKLIEELLLYQDAKATINGQTNFNKKLFNECLQIGYNLQGKKQHQNSAPITVDDFLNMEVDEISISSLKIDASVTIILEQRIIEVKKCLKSEASLSVIFLCGSILEGILLGIATKKIMEFNQSAMSPKEKETGKVKQFHNWTLSNFIDVASDIKLLGLDVKKFSHSLRDFRNYIHPYQQMSSGFNPDKHTAQISWQVLKAAIHDIHEKIK